MREIKLTEQQKQILNDYMDNILDEIDQEEDSEIKIDILLNEIAALKVFEIINDPEERNK